MVPGLAGKVMWPVSNKYIVNQWTSIFYSETKAISVIIEI